MDQYSQWLKQRDQWRKPTKPYPKSGPDIYEPSDLTLQVCEHIDYIVTSIKGPYPAFSKKINLADLASLVQEIWEDDRE